MTSDMITGLAIGLAVAGLSLAMAFLAVLVQAKAMVRDQHDRLMARTLSEYTAAAQTFEQRRMRSDILQGPGFDQLPPAPDEDEGEQEGPLSDEYLLNVAKSEAGYAKHVG